MTEYATMVERWVGLQRKCKCKCKGYRRVVKEWNGKERRWSQENDITAVSRNCVFLCSFLMRTYPRKWVWEGVDAVQHGVWSIAMSFCVTEQHSCHKWRTPQMQLMRQTYQVHSTQHSTQHNTQHSMAWHGIAAQHRMRRCRCSRMYFFNAIVPAQTHLNMCCSICEYVCICVCKVMCLQHNLHMPQRKAGRTAM